MVRNPTLKKKINVVWLKRDLRTEDHEPLYLAERESLPYLIFFLFEPSLLLQADTSLRHLQFQYHSILKINSRLSKYGHKFHVLYGEAIDVFQKISETFQINSVFSYRESGTQITYDRDISVRSFLRKHNTNWIECKRDGILRGIKTRDGWDDKWEEYVSSPIPTNHFTPEKAIAYDEPLFSIPNHFLEEIKTYPKNFQPPGEGMAKKYLDSFVLERGFSYNKHISKPLESRRSCGRISPYLAWGNISVRQVVQFIRSTDFPPFAKRNFTSFLQRVKWRSHFMQKFELDCSYETKFLNSGFDSLQYNKNENHLEAWKSGQTGFPLVDACMRCLEQTGWINFRMRAMLVSFATHNLFMDWRDISKHLARLFLDYEPGIHYPQIQMQAGTTGINLIRIYNPEKQSLDQDPTATFIRTYIPELSSYPLSYIHSPQVLSEMEKVLLGIPLESKYPSPIMNSVESARKARETLYALRKTDSVRTENKKILKSGMTR